MLVLYSHSISCMVIYYRDIHPIPVSGPGLGERCDGGSDEEEEAEDSTGMSESSESSDSEDSTGKKRKKDRVRKVIRGARERQAYGELDEAELQCQDDLVCVEVEEDRRECQPENPNGT